MSDTIHGYRIEGTEFEDALYEYCEPYYAEIAQHTHLKPCPNTARDTFRSALHYPEHYAVIVAESEGDIMGVAIIVKGRSFFEGTEADIDFMYVRPEHRGSGSSRRIVEACRNWADLEGVTILYGGCATFLGMSNNQKYVNLYKKFGFEELGSIVCYKGEK